MSRYWSSLVHRLTPLCSGRAAEAAEARQAEHQRESLSAVAARARCDCRRTGGRRRTLRLYPDPNADRLKEAVAARFAEFGITPQQVFVGNGSDEVLAHVFMALLKHEQADSLPGHHLQLLPGLLRLYDIAYVTVPLDEDFAIRVDDYAAANGGIIFPNPNAPTGLPAAARGDRASAAPHRQSVVVVDEAYIDFGGESAIALVNRHPNLLVVHTLSKSHSLAGLRVGYAVGQPT
jgi:histidinol-phosphate aminotransferase